MSQGFNHEWNGNSPSYQTNNVKAGLILSLLNFEPEPFADHLSLLVGSPKRTHVRRTSLSETADFALAVTSPRVSLPSESNNRRYACWFIAVAGGRSDQRSPTAIARPANFQQASPRLR